MGTKYLSRTSRREPYPGTCRTLRARTPPSLAHNHLHSTLSCEEISSDVRVLVALRVGLLEPRQERGDRLHCDRLAVALSWVVGGYPRLESLFRHHVAVVQRLEDTLNQTFVHKKQS